MDISTLSGSTAANTAQTTASIVDPQLTQMNKTKTQLTIPPLRDTVQISDEARSLSTQMSVSPLRLVSREDSVIVETTTDPLVPVTVKKGGNVIVEGNSSTLSLPPLKQTDLDQEPSWLKKAQQKLEEQQQAQEVENKSQQQLREVETEIGRAQRDITLLVGRAAINESVRDQLHEKKSELSVLMMELTQLESVSTSNLQ